MYSCLPLNVIIIAALMFYYVMLRTFFLNYLGMRKLKLSVHRQNEVRKKYSCLYKVRIPRHAVTILKVSVPVSKLSFRVSLPLPVYMYLNMPVSSLALLRRRTTESQVLPHGTCMYVCVYVHMYVFTYVCVHVHYVHIVCVRYVFDPNNGTK